MLYSDLYAQQKDSLKTQLLAEVTVYSTSLRPGFKVETLDTLVLQRSQQQELSTVLAAQSPVFIKFYGAGSLASSAFRGMSSTHTQVYWNGLLLNSPMLGQLDFSLIPMAATDHVEILYGAAALRMGNGGLGGGIHLENKPCFDEKVFQGQVRLLTASFGTYKGSFQSTVRYKKILWQQKYFLRQADNNFSFRFNGQDMRQQNAFLRQVGSIQELYYRPDKRQTWALRVWQQQGFRQLPASILVGKSTEKQDDRSLKIHLEHQYRSPYKLNYQHKTWLAYTSDRLVYQNPAQDQKSSNAVHAAQGQTLHSLDFSDAFSLRASFALAHEQVQSSAYAQTQTRPQVHTEAHGRWGSLEWSAVIRQEHIRSHEAMYRMPTTGALGCFITILQQDLSRLNLQMQVAQNARYPTLNDRFWPISGNEELLPERSQGAEVQIDYKKYMAKKTQKPILEVQITAYNNRVEDWIQWLPTVSGYWKPQNLRQVAARGLEANIKNSINFTEKHALKISVLYSLNSSINTAAYTQNDKAVGKQLIYTPLHNIKARIDYLILEKWHFNLQAQYYSRRYTTSDNSSYLPAYILFDTNASYQISKHLKINTTIDNILNFQYQSIAFFPMHGRRFELQVVWSF